MRKEEEERKRSQVKVFIFFPGHVHGNRYGAPPVHDCGPRGRKTPVLHVRLLPGDHQGTVGRILEAAHVGRNVLVRKKYFPKIFVRVGFAHLDVTESDYPDGYVEKGGERGREEGRRAISGNPNYKPGVDGQWSKGIVLVNCLVSPLFILVCTESILKL
jgi:hypothetical protein